MPTVTVSASRVQGSSLRPVKMRISEGFDHFDLVFDLIFNLVLRVVCRIFVRLETCDRPLHHKWRPLEVPASSKGTTALYTAD